MLYTTFSGNVTIRCTFRFYSWDFGQEIFCRDYFRGLTRRLDIKARVEPSSARPQEAVRGECGDNNYTRVVLQIYNRLEIQFYVVYPFIKSIINSTIHIYNRMTSIKIPCGPDIFPLLLFLPFLMSLSSSALIRSVTR